MYQMCSGLAERGRVSIVRYSSSWDMILCSYSWVYPMKQGHYEIYTPIVLVMMVKCECKDTAALQTNRVQFV